MFRKLLLTGTAIGALILATPEPAQAEPISLAIASTAASVIGAGGIGAFTFASFAQGITSVLASFAVRAALGYALQALTPKPTEINRGYSVDTFGAALPHAIIYGETEVGGGTFYQTVTGDGAYLHRCIAFAGHEIEEYSSIYFNGEEITVDGSGNVTVPTKYAGYVRVNEHLGSTTQTADTDLVSEVTEWTTNHRARGVAYLYVRFYHDGTTAADELYAGGFPTVTALVKGKNVYDPRDATTAWSDNPALCLRDYLTSDYGLNASASEINDDLVKKAASICENDILVATDPEAETTASVTKSDGDTVTHTTDVDQTKSIFVAADVILPDADPDGIIWEQGDSTTDGAYMGFTNGEFVFRAGDAASGSDVNKASMSINVDKFLGGSYTILGSIEVSTGKVQAWFYDYGTGALHAIGNDTAASGFNSSNWTSTAAGAIGQVNGTAVSGESTANFNGTINEVRFFQDTTFPATSGNTSVEDRYTCNGSFLLDASPEDIIRGIASSMGGLFWYQDGKFAFRAAAYVEPVFSFNEDDYRTELRIATKHSRRDNFNTVTGVYRGPDSNHQETEYDTVSDPVYVTEDNEETVSTTLDLLFTNTETMAKRIAMLSLRRNRQQITVSGGFGLRALQISIGDTIKLSDENAGWTDKIFECVDWKLGMTDNMDLQVGMILREANLSVFG